MKQTVPIRSVAVGVIVAVVVILLELAVCANSQPSAGGVAVVVPTPAQVAPTTATPDPIALQPSEAKSALALLAQIPTATSIAGGYERSAFGPAWQDTNRNGCDTRNDVLGRDLTSTVFKPGTRNCLVLSGILHDPYTGSTISFVRGNVTSEAVQIDHVVPLAWAWRYGANEWTPEQLLDYANDEADLLAVDGHANQSKSDSGPANWLPPNTAFQCDYVARFVTTVSIYRLSIDTSDRLAARRVLSSCF